jgi:mannose-6-phosphate isomerase
MAETVYPLLFEPVLKNYIWGGRNLEKLGRCLPPGLTAESWEIAAHEDGTAVVSNGHFAGQPLTSVHQELGLALIGTNNAWAQGRNKFPLLIKLLDANWPLSVQVHPDDDYALEHEGNELGKTEMWVVLHAEPEAAIILGVTPGTTPANFRQAILERDLEKYLHRIPVKAGDVVCVPAGSLHAILGGLIIAEIQQNSNTTYRVYDWNRVDAEGKGRPLHIDKALDVINFDQVAPELCQPELIDQADGVADGVRRYRLCRNRYFVTEQVDMEAGAEFNGRCDGSTLEIWGVIEGEVKINDVGLTAVGFTLLPAALGDFAIRTAGRGTLLRSYVASR